MKARVIVSKTERSISPWISLLLSLFFTGLGELYSGIPFSGIALALARIIVLLSVPFYTIINSRETMTEEILVFCLALLVITISSPVNSFIAGRKRKAYLSWYNSALFYLLFMIISILLTAFSAGVFFSTFEIKRASADAPPLIKKGSFIIVKKLHNAEYTAGDMVKAEIQNGVTYLRVIGVPGDKISCEKGRILSDGSELPRSIFSEEELGKFSLSDYDVVSEQNGNVRYPVKSDVSLKMPETLLAADEYMLAPDIRTTAESFIRITSGGIRGRIEGIIYSPGSGFLPGKISIPADNTLSAR